MGIGPGLFGRAFRDYRDPDLARDRMGAAHNAYLGTAAEAGLIGVIVSLWLGVVIVRTWWRRWQEATSAPRKIRIEVMVAALVGIAVHSMVDIFITTPMVLLIALLIAYSTIGHRTVLDVREKGQGWPVVVLLITLLGYGIWLIQIDRAQSHYQRSLTGGDDALDEARAAAEIDPDLNLYQLQIAHLLGERAINGSSEDLGEAIAAYEYALELEPTWDTGWLNLAALVELQGQYAASLRLRRNRLCD